MSRFFEFASNHPVLMGLLIALIIVFFLLESRRQGAKVSPSELGILTNQQGAKVIDLDGPLLMAGDRDPGLTFDGSIIRPCPTALWG